MLPPQTGEIAVAVLFAVVPGGREVPCNTIVEQGPDYPGYAGYRNGPRKRSTPAEG